MIMVMAVMVLTVVIFLAVTAAITSTAETRMSGHAYQQAQAFYVAEGFNHYGMDTLRTILRTNLTPTPEQLSAIAPPQAPAGFTRHGFAIQKVDSSTQQVGQGPFKDLDATVETYGVTSSASRSEETVTIQQGVELLSICIFDFFLFWNEDLEMYYNQPITFDGRIHSNGNIYLGTMRGMTFNSSVTAAGHIYHHAKGGGVISPPGSINIMDFWGSYQDMFQGEYWLDATQPTWEGEAIERWGGMVMDSSHGIQPMWFDVASQSTPQIEVIKRGLPSDTPELRQAKYYYQATVRILNGIAYDSNGVTINMGPGTLTFDSFYDHRERRTMYVTQLDIGAMIANGTVPSNGIIYMSGSLAGDAVRLINAQTLPANGLSIVTDNPVYVYGDYNTTPVRPASIISDAVTVLSSAFDDERTLHGFVNQQAVETWVNACLMTGNQESVWYGGIGGEFNGGMDNVIRFLERWSSTYLHFQGSMIALWRSEQATGMWRNGSYFSPPIRDYGFNPDLLDPGNLPPSAPIIHVIQAGSWRQIS